MRGFAQWNGQFLPAPLWVRIMYIMLNYMFGYVPDFVTSIIHLAHCINRFLQ